MVDEDSSDGSSGARQPRKKRVRRWLVLGGTTPFLLLLLALVFRGAWLGPILIRYVCERARVELGGELAIERVSGGWFHDLTLEGVSWSSARPPLLGVREARIELGYSLLGAWQGAPELVVRVQARGVELELGAAGSGSGSSSSSSSSSMANTLPDLARVELDLAELVVRQGGREPERVESLRASGGLRGGKAQVDELELVAGPNRVALARAVLDLTQRDWLALVRSFRGELAATLPDGRVFAGLLGRALALRSAELTLSAESGTARLAGRIELEYGRLEIERGELRLPASGGLEELQLDLGLSAELSDLAPLGALLGQPLAGRWRGSIDVRGPWRAPVGRFVGRGEALRVAGLAFDLVELDVETDGKLARIERCEISGPELEAVLRGGLRLEPLELVDVALNVSADATPLAVLLPFPCEHAFVHARLAGPPRALRGAFELSANGTQLGGIRIDDAEARGALDADTLQVSELRLTSGESFAEAAGTLQRSGTSWTAELERLGLQWRGARAELERGARLAFGLDSFSVDGLELISDSAGTPGRAGIALRHADGVTRGTLDFEHYDAGSLLAPFLPPGWKAGRASGHLEGELGGAGGAGAAPALEIDLALEDWRVSSAWPELDAQLRGGFDGHELTLERFELGFEEGEAAHARGELRVPFDPGTPLALAAGPVELRLELETRDAAASLRRAGIEPGLSATGPCRFGLDLAGRWSALGGSLTVDARAITLGVEAGARACDLEAEVWFGERTRIERALFTAPSGTITLTGEVGAALDVPRWLTDRWALLDAPLELAAKLDLADIGWIAGLSANLRRVSGQVAGRVTVGGTALEPVLGGALELRGGELRVASASAPPVRNVAANLSFEDDLVRLEELVGEVGGSPVRASGTIEPFGPFRRLDLELAGENLLLLRDAHLVLRADTELVVKGTPSQLAIRGELRLAEGRFTTEISPLEELLQAGKRSQSPPTPKHFSLWSEGFLAGAELDVHLGGERAFEYRTNLFEATLRPDAWLRGTGFFPVLEGSLYVEEASLILPSGTLEFDGLLTFRREAPLRPEAALTAEMRVQRHDVTATITGPLDEPDNVELSSSPPLPTDDLWMLLLTGQLPAARGEDRNAQAMEALAVFLARDTLVRWFGSEPGDAESLLERFEIDVGAKTSESGQPTGRALFYLRPRDRRSGRATYLSAELDVHDRANFALGIVFRPR